VDDSPFLLIQVGEVVLVEVGHVLDEGCIHAEILNDVFAPRVFEGGEYLLGVPDDTLRCMISHVVDWPAKSVQHKLSRHANAKKAVPSRMRLRLRQTYLRKACHGNGVLDPCPVVSLDLLDGSGHPETICEVVSQPVNVCTSLGIG